MGRGSLASSPDGTEEITTFFPAGVVPGDDDDTTRASIRKAVAWSKTTRGGMQFDLMMEIEALQAQEEGWLCESAYGLCE